MSRKRKPSRISQWSRRRFIQDASLLAVVPPVLGSCAAQPQEGRAFQHGVASGDPLHDRVVIWTRVSSPARLAVKVRWQLAADRDFRKLVAKGSTATGPDIDYTVNVDVSGLLANTIYYYRFEVAGDYSTVGRTKTLPVGDIDAVSMAVVSCSNYPAGFFNVYGAISRLTDIDVVLHLGDYIYEYGEFGYQTRYASAMNRVPEPRHETISLQDYRTRFAQYRLDHDLQAMHAAHPMIAIWDDHEFANNSSSHGAENHSGDEGEWRDRQNAAARAYREWIPLRTNASGNSIYRSFDFGNLASLSMLDTRMEGRDPIPTMETLQHPSEADAKLRMDQRAKKFSEEVLNDPSRTLLGAAQSEWLREELQKSALRNVPWQLIGQQIVISSVIAPDLSSSVTENTLAGMSDGLRRILEGIIALGKMGLPMNLDSWDGYAAAREDLYADMLACANNAIVLSGDSHSAGASDLIDRNGVQVGVEFAVTSVTSSGFGAYLPDIEADDLHALFHDRNAKLRYLNVYDNGYCVCRLTPEKATNEWYVVDTTRSQDFNVSLHKTLSVKRSTSAGRSALQED